MSSLLLLRTRSSRRRRCSPPSVCSCTTSGSLVEGPALVDTPGADVIRIDGRRDLPQVRSLCQLLRSTGPGCPLVLSRDRGRPRRGHRGLGHRRRPPRTPRRSASSKGTVAGVAKAVSPSIVEIKAASSSGSATGSGVIVTEDGEVVTNNHVVAGASQIQVRTSDGKSYSAQVVGTDPAKDLALIKLEDASGLKAATSATRRRAGRRPGRRDRLARGSHRHGDQRHRLRARPGRHGVHGREPGAAAVAARRRLAVRVRGQEFNGDTGGSTTTYKAIQTNVLRTRQLRARADRHERQHDPRLRAVLERRRVVHGGSVGLGFAIPVNTLKADLPEPAGRWQLAAAEPGNMRR
ncbi:hypothetical protein SALBM217S_06405 [Streptomyces griseoloalbus]